MSCSGCGLDFGNLQAFLALVVELRDQVLVVRCGCPDYSPIDYVAQAFAWSYAYQLREGILAAQMEFCLEGRSYSEDRSPAVCP